MTNSSYFLPRDLLPKIKGEPNEVHINPNSGRRGSNEYTSFEANGFNHEEALAFLQDNHMTHIKVLDDGSYCGIYPLAFTWAVCTDVGPNTAYTYRWCFKDPNEAIAFITELKEFDEVPDFTRYKSIRGHRYSDAARAVKNDEHGWRMW